MNLRRLLLAALGLFLALSALSVFADTYTRNPALVGRWKYEDSTKSSVVVLAADGTWAASITLRDSADQPIQVGGKWLTDERYIYWLYTATSSNSRAKPGTRDKDALVEIEKDRFVLESRAKDRIEYVRVK